MFSVLNFDNLSEFIVPENSFGNELIVKLILESQISENEFRILLSFKHVNMCSSFCSSYHSDCCYNNLFDVQCLRLHFINRWNENCKNFKLNKFLFSLSLFLSILEELRTNPTDIGCDCDRISVVSSSVDFIQLENSHQLISVGTC